MEEREWPPRFRQDELAGMMMPDPAPAYLEIARKLAHTAALSEVLCAQVDAYPMYKKLGIIQIAYLEEHQSLDDQVIAIAHEIGADVEKVTNLSRAEVECLTGISYGPEPYERYAETQQIIRGRQMSTRKPLSSKIQPQNH